MNVFVYKKERNTEKNKLIDNVYRKSGWNLKGKPQEALISAQQSLKYLEKAEKKSWMNISGRCRERYLT